jgi:hypothetical protein
MKREKFGELQIEVKGREANKSPRMPLNSFRGGVLGLFDLSGFKFN